MLSCVAVITIVVVIVTAPIIVKPLSYARASVLRMPSAVFSRFPFANEETETRVVWHSKGSQLVNSERLVGSSFFLSKDQAHCARIMMENSK